MLLVSKIWTRRYSSEIRGFCLKFLPRKNASKFAKFLEYENPCSFFFIWCYFINYFFPYVDNRPGLQGIRGKNKLEQTFKMKKLDGISYSKNMANFEAFCWGNNFSKNLFLRSSKRTNIFVVTIFYILTRKVDMQSFSMSETSEKIHKELFQ